MAENNNQKRFSAPAIKFYCRPSKAGKKDGKAPIEMSLIINGQRTYIQLPHEKVVPEEFDRLRNSNRDNELKQFLQTSEAKAHKYMKEMFEDGVEITTANLRQCIISGNSNYFYTLGDLWGAIKGIEADKLEADVIDRHTYDRYILAEDAFYAGTGYTKDSPASKVTLPDINKFQAHLSKDKGLDQKTIYNYQARAKRAFEYAFRSGKIKATPYAGFQMSKGKRKEIVWLTEEELERIKNKPMVSDRLEKVKDLFLFQCYSGLAFADMMALTPEDFQTTEDGIVLIEKERVKTGQVFKSIILDDGKKILEKYGYQLPTLSNQKMNSYLKEIGDVCGIDKSLHTHLGRTTYICYLYNHGVPIGSIAEIAGHSTANTTLTYYAKMDTKSVVKVMKEKKLVSAPASKEDEAKRRRVERINAITERILAKEKERVFVTKIQ